MGISIVKAKVEKQQEKIHFLLLLLYFRIIACVLSNFFPYFSQVFPTTEHKAVYVSIITYSSAVNATAIFPLPLTGGRGAIRYPQEATRRPGRGTIYSHKAVLCRLFALYPYAIKQNNVFAYFYISKNVGISMLSVFCLFLYIFTDNSPNKAGAAA